MSLATSTSTSVSVSIPLKIRSRDLFQSVTDFKIALKRAEAQATERAKAVLYAYILAHELIPFKTGAMVESAATWLLRTALAGQFEVEIWFSIFYATYVEDKVHFMNKIKPDIYAIIQKELEDAYRQAGIDVVVTING